jgi:FADH2 O2-dependent halogenase
LLPHTAGFIDPLHSTGIAHTMCGIERLVRILEEHWGRESLPEQLQSYAATVGVEIEFIDRLVAGCYACLGEFDLFVLSAMLYFAAATTYERRRLAGALPAGAAFLCADDPQLQTVVARMSAVLQANARGEERSSLGALQRFVAEQIAPFNVAGLCDPAVQNMYRYTAVPAV